MEDFIPIFAIFAVFGTITAIVFGPTFLKYREKRDMQETVRLAVDKGQELPPELLDAMLAQAHADHPIETCGVIAGPGGSEFKPEGRVCFGLAQAGRETQVETVDFGALGRAKALAVAGPKRSPLLPDVPTLKEAGVDGVEVQQWYALFAPGKTPKAVVDRLNKALNDVLRDKEVIKRMEDHGADVETSTPEQLGAMVKSELVKWKDVVTKAKLTAE